ncbi:OsmC family protein [Streptococcus porcinus]|uniref:OsmC family protein n=2 Tax=Streptococcus porcinus TaxID=1340 RepID=A0A4V0H7S6_STRPO|nr:OsmC family protein [Streptococcus porcinus]EGJ26782.1 OsmC-like protein [Streptococcus porcinus str. Jelinkova 176]MBA2795039.1 OsmC family protein [Streptococcus porcinus]SQG44530.1 putative ribosomal protein [Streptococcus porcinus]VTT44495.1 putative ribosomal protein [Streptococcus porcinus]VTT45815.1 putative ribosomal protein [Streptococcus porcinus]
MYQTEIRGDYLYHTKSKGYGAEIELFGATDDGETPMSLLNIALASCVTMCIQSYFKTYEKMDELSLKTESHYDNRAFTLTVHMKVQLSQQQQNQLMAFIKKKCRVSKLLAPDVAIKIDFKTIL